MMLNKVLSLSFLRSSSAKTDFKLLQKTGKRLIKRYNSSEIWAVPQEASFFTEVKVGKKSDSTFFRNITSFYDKDKKLIKRAISGSDINNKIRLYEHSYEFAGYKNMSVLEADARRITTKEYVKDKYSYLGKWKISSFEEQFAYNFYEGPNKTERVTKLHTNKTIHDLFDDSRRSCVMTEYPKNKGYEPKSAKKVMGLEIVMVKGMPKITGYQHTPNVKIPEFDEFLPYRFLNGSEKQEALTRHFLREKHLDNLGIAVYTNESNVSHDALAHFSAYVPEICWRGVNETRQPVVTAAHEVEHAYQYAQIGRLGKGRNKYEKDCLKKFGKITDIKEREEAYKYLIASENYPSKEQSDYIKKYRDNYLEQNARQAGCEAAEVYNICREYLRSVFKFLPKGCRYL